MAMKLEEQSEERIVEAARNGHLESFGALYERYYNPMVALAYSMLADRDMAEDAAQESFMVACRDLPNLKRKDKFAAWLAGICRNVTKQILRTKDRTILADVEQPKQGQDDPDQRCDAIRQAVWKLREAERELIVLHYFNGFSRAQICQVLGISPQAVNGRLVRAKRKIAKNLKRIRQDKQDNPLDLVRDRPVNPDRKRNGFTGIDYETP